MSDHIAKAETLQCWYRIFMGNSCPRPARWWWADDPDEVVRAMMSINTTRIV